MSEQCFMIKQSNVERTFTIEIYLQIEKKFVFEITKLIFIRLNL